MRPRTGSLWLDRGKLYARVTWTDKDGKRRSIRRRAMDETHARSLCQEMLQDLGTRKRVQPNRAKKYGRDNLLIYCIQILDGSLFPIKIGTSANIPMRIKMILTHQPHEVRLLATWKGSVLDERADHAMFKESHISREWFRPTPELLSYIESKSQSKAA